MSELWDPLDGNEPKGRKNEEQLYLLPAYWRQHEEPCPKCGASTCTIAIWGVKKILDVKYAYRKKNVRGCRTTRVHACPKGLTTKARR